MSPRKLTNDNKKEILKLYRETGETTSTLAERYGVSSSTISRFLKTHLTESEYEDLIQQKRLARTPKGALQLELEKIYKSDNVDQTFSPLPLDESQSQLELELEDLNQEQPNELDEPDESVQSDEVRAVEAIQERPIQTPSLPVLEKQEVKPKPKIDKEVGNKFPAPVSFSSSAPKTIDDEEDDEEDEDLATVDVGAYAMLDDDLLYFDEDEDDLDEDEDDWEDELDIKYPKTFSKTAQLQILPITSAAFPKTCYLVIDRAAELITRPLKEFAELGKIPSEEIQQKTLPVFDNHRVARRFSKRRERVIKIPDGRLIPKTRSYLEAKGITRLLLDGQIYSL